MAASDELFYRRGVHSTGIDTVIERAGVAKGSLYYNFGGKDQLIEAYLDGRHDAWIARVSSSLEATDDPADRILAVFDAIGEYIALPGFRGSEFTNAAAEASDDGPEMRAAERFRKALHAFFFDLATQTGVDDPAGLTQQLVVLHDGALATAQLDAVGDAAVARQMAKLVLLAAGVTVSPAADDVVT